MYSAFDHWAYWSHMLTAISMFSPCTQWVFGPLSPVSLLVFRSTRLVRARGFTLTSFKNQIRLSRTSRKTCTKTSFPRISRSPPDTYSCTESIAFEERMTAVKPSKKRKITRLPNKGKSRLKAEQVSSRWTPIPLSPTRFDPGFRTGIQSANRLRAPHKNKRSRWPETKLQVQKIGRNPPDKKNKKL